MRQAKKGINMAPMIPTPDLPQSAPDEKKRLVQAEVNVELWDVVEREIKKQKVTIRSVTEWGFAAWLSSVNPDAYKRFRKVG